MAKITTVTFEALVQTRQFENKRIAATATVETGDDPATVRAALEAFVYAQLGRGPSAEEVAEAIAKADLLKKQAGATAILKNVVAK